jgi:hypothetical protein
VIAADGSWHHVAAQLRRHDVAVVSDGNVDATLSVRAFTPRFDSIQHAAIGTALNSTGAVTSGQTAGRFQGAIDEAPDLELRAIAGADSERPNRRPDSQRPARPLWLE